MATFNSTVYAKQISPTLGNRNAGLTVSAGVLFATITYAMAGTEAAGAIINLVKLPMGVQIDPTLSTITSEGVATTLTVDVGDDDVLGVGLAADVDRYADGLDCAAAGIDKFDSIIAATRLTPYTLGSESTITATFQTLATPVAGKKLVFRIAYFAEV